MKRTTTLTRPKAAPKGEQQYKGNGNHEWEDVKGNTSRLRVPGGWLYRYEPRAAAPTMVFVPVPEVVGYVV